MVTNQARLNAWSKNDGLPPIRINQGDVMSRRLNLTLTDANSQHVDLTGASARLHFAKPDRTVVYIDATVTNEKTGQIQATLTSQVAAVAGLVKATVQITWLQGEASQELFCSGLTLQVIPNNVAESVESSNEFSALLKLQIEGGKTFADLSEKVDQGNTAINVLTDAITSAGEHERNLDGLITGGTALEISLGQGVADAQIAQDTLDERIAIANDAIEDLTPIQNQITDIKSYVGYTEDDIYGLETDFQTGVSKRLAGAANKTAGAMFDNVECFGGRRRCNVTDGGAIVAYYGDAAYTETGKLAQSVTIGTATYPVGTAVQVMVYQPRFYYKVVPLTLEKIVDGKGFHMRKARYYVSATPKTGFKIHPAFVKNGVEKPYVLIGAFEASLYDSSATSYILNDAQVADFTASTGDKLSSIANAKPISGLTQTLTRRNCGILAENRGSGWSQQTIQAATATELLFLVEYASFDMQSKIGIGVTNKTDDGSTSMTEITGATTNLGNTTGSVINTNGFNVVTYRGEENFFGNIWKWIDGININAKGIHEAYIADNTFTDGTLNGVYSNAGITLAKTNGYVSAFGYNEDYDWLFLASETLGNSSLPVGDYFYQNNTYDGTLVAGLGGSWYDGAAAGGFSWSVGSAASYRSRNVGGRLLYVPTGGGLPSVQVQIDELKIGKLDQSEKGTANGVATLGADGKLVQMPTAADVGASTPADLAAAQQVTTAALTLQNGFSVYDPTETPTIRKIGKMVWLTGSLKPPADNIMGTPDGGSMPFAVLPEGFRPRQTFSVLCMGSGYAIWRLLINKNGTVTGDRYREGTTYVKPAIATWLPFSAAFITD